ncbi:protein lin-37 homolog [Boleophthalmus pectinirostris]|uniref:protein lin-37 homolog n=1 Tax=Boleophthalmus pectinirostris TaxID=150288 RepID=UPI000A1C1D90|nr:protein lin-37 homolog [Boleophthalmus pectinirostris]
MHHIKIKTERPDMEASGARFKLDAVLQGLVEKSETEMEQNESEAGKTAETSNKDSSPLSGKRPPSRFPQHRRKKRKEMDESMPDTNQNKQNAYIIKLFDRSVDLAQFNSNTPLYPICRSWMRNNPSFRERADPTPLSPHSVTDEELTDNVNGKEQDVHRLPPPTPCPVSPSGEPVNLRIPPTDKPAVKKPTDKIPSSGPRISDHMVRWKKIRQKWKECSNRNQLRYSESIKILKEMKELYDH